MWRTTRLLVTGLVVSAGGGLNAAECDLTAHPLGTDLDLSSGMTTNLGGHSVAYNQTDLEFLCVWFDSRISGQNDVYGQRVSPTGSLLGVNETVTAGADSATDTSVAHRPAANQYLVTWRHQAGGPGSQGFNPAFGRIVSAAIVPITTPMDMSNGGLEATLVYNPTADEFMLEARNFAGGGVAGIYARRISPAGSPLNSDIIVSSSGAPAPAGQIAYNPADNQYLATWRDQTNSDLRGRILNADGSFATSAFIISSVFPSSTLAASVAFDPVDTRYFVVFGTFSGGPILGQFVTAAGVPDGPTLTLVNSAASLFPYVSYDPINEVFLLGWREGSNISVQLLSRQGNILGSAVPLVTGTATRDPRIAADTTAGGFLVVWADNRNTGQSDTFARLIGVGIDSPCEGDLDCDGLVSTSDLLALLSAWGTFPAGPPDYDGGGVGTGDLLILLSNWGPCPP
jgi:hypothetical protein